VFERTDAVNSLSRAIRGSSLPAATSSCWSGVWGGLRYPKPPAPAGLTWSSLPATTSSCRSGVVFATPSHQLLLAWRGLRYLQPPAPAGLGWSSLPSTTSSCGLGVVFATPSHQLLLVWGGLRYPGRGLAGCSSQL